MHQRYCVIPTWNAFRLLSKHIMYGTYEKGLLQKNHNNASKAICKLVKKVGTIRLKIISFSSYAKPYYC